MRVVGVESGMGLTYEGTLQEILTGCSIFIYPVGKRISHIYISGQIYVDLL